MSDTSTTTVVTIGGEQVRLERFSSRKTRRLLRVVRHLGDAVPDILQQRATFIREYSEANGIELDRAQALMRFGAPIPITNADGVLVRDENGAPVTVPAPITEMTDSAWAAIGNKMRLPEYPDIAAQAFALLPTIQDRAEAQLYQLAALLLMSNRDVKQHDRAGTLFDSAAARAAAERLPAEGEAAAAPAGQGELSKRADDLLDDSEPAELLELLAVAGELVDDQVLQPAREVRSRLGKTLRVFGLGPEDPTTPPSEPEPKIPTDSTPEETPPSSSTSPPAPEEPSGSRPSMNAGI